VVKTVKKPVNVAITLDSIGVIATPKATKKGGNPDKIMESIANLTAIGRVIADLETAEAVVDQEVREAAKTLFLNDGCAIKARPQNFNGCEFETVNGVELRHSVSVELRNYGSGLSAEAQALATEYKVPVETVDTVPATYIINPAYATDMDMMGKLLKALNAAVTTGDLPTDILQRQEGQNKVVTTEQTLPAIFAMEREQAELLLPVFSTLAVGKGKFGSLPGQEDDLTPALDRTAKLLNRPNFRNEMQATAAAMKAKKSKRAA
jgi:hypothetical protein